MRNRLWMELCQAKWNNKYCAVLLTYRRRVLNWVTILILVFSGAGVMGWKFWETMPFISCLIISAIQIVRLVQPHLFPTEKQIEKLEFVTDFYFDYYNKLEKLWFDYENERIDEENTQLEFYKLKDSEKEVNKIINEVIKTVDKKMKEKCDKATEEYFNRLIVII
ncbi:hypothetical protein [Pedobacter sp. UBA4863]|uniref:hypothetical protein n=1 Tax=Pedobacter sp. UBA4863 TaxID=1947060 RepID=UPI0025F23CB7|nr:hypothetical protein [Pedobacter sp. UBA4863]